MPNQKHMTIQSTQNKGTALVLAIFLGWLGVHGFYTGKVLYRKSWNWHFMVVNSWFIQMLK